MTGSGEFSLQLSGHAGYAPAGSDAVCAAASMLAYTAAREVLELERGGKLREAPRIKLDKGDGEVSCKFRGSSWDEVKALYRVIANGYDLLAANFPSHVSFTVF